MTGEFRNSPQSAECSGNPRAAMTLEFRLQRERESETIFAGKNGVQRERPAGTAALTIPETFGAKSGKFCRACDAPAADRSTTVDDNRRSAR